MIPHKAGAGSTTSQLQEHKVELRSRGYLTTVASLDAYFVVSAKTPQISVLPGGNEFDNPRDHTKM
jgi:hypothetical protein